MLAIFLGIICLFALSHGIWLPCFVYLVISCIKIVYNHYNDMQIKQKLENMTTNELIDYFHRMEVDISKSQTRIRDINRQTSSNVYLK